MENSTPVFVYGTLRNGEHNYDYYLRDNTVIEMPGTLTGHKMFGIGDANYGYPTIMKVDDQSMIVHGELIWLNTTTAERTMEKLDYLEGYDPGHPERSLFGRVKVSVEWEAGAFVDAWVYVWNRGVDRLDYDIPGGDWLKRDIKPRRSRTKIER